MGGFRVLEPGVVEIKRMYVAAGARGRGLSRRMLAALEAAAAEQGAQRVVLCTGYVQVAAMALYESSGYRPIAPFGHYAQTTGAHFFGKVLTEAGLNGDGPSVTDGPLALSSDAIE
jgi:ribosomal protein S18 acetylase RimI-like enzyme